MTSFWDNLPRPFFALAPMEAVTDVVFRHVVAAATPPDVYFTEFTNAASYCSPAGEHSTRGRLTFTPDEQPIVAQIWGNRPEQFEQMSRGLAQGPTLSRFAGIDINMGCPDKTVVKNGGGSGLIRQPELAAELITSAKAGGLPVSVKTRLGYSSTDEWRDWLTHLLKQDIVNLTIHLRTRKEMSKVPAHYELIADIKQLRDEIAPQTLLTINGDIENRQEGEELVRKYGVDGVMIGRGVFHDPFAFAKSEHNTAFSLPSFSSGALSANYSYVLHRSAGKAEPSEKEAANGWPVENETKRPPAIGLVASVYSETSAQTREMSERDSWSDEDCLSEASSAVAQGLRERASLRAEAVSEDAEATSKEAGIHRKDELLALLHLHLDLFDKYSAELEPRKFEPLKRFFKIYIRDFPGASNLREQLMRTKNTDEVREILANYE